MQPPTKPPPAGHSTPSPSSTCIIIPFPLFLNLYLVLNTPQFLTGHLFPQAPPVGQAPKAVFVGVTTLTQKRPFLRAKCIWPLPILIRVPAEVTYEITDRGSSKLILLATLTAQLPNNPNAWNIEEVRLPHRAATLSPIEGRPVLARLL